MVKGIGIVVPLQDLEIRAGGGPCVSRGGWKEGTGVLGMLPGKLCMLFNTTSDIGGDA
jgi:hypothetical protein